jgi:hypothetical protein
MGGQGWSSADHASSAMIERFALTLRALATLPSSELRTTEGRRLAADCADAVRLVLDCPQHELTVHQRRTFRALGDVLEDDDVSGDELRAAVLAAGAAAGLDGAVPGRSPKGGV